jgi:hypothetical protein
MILTTVTLMMSVGVSILYTAPNSYAQIPIVGNPCPKGHECICTALDGIFHDLTAKLNISMRCDGTEGVNEGQ